MLARIRGVTVAMTLFGCAPPNGHWNGVFSIAQAGERIRAFLK
jgi:hypothetical protein